MLRTYLPETCGMPFETSAERSAWRISAWMKRNITPRDPLQHFLLSISAILSNVSNFKFSGENLSSRGTVRISLNFKLWPLFGHFLLLSRVQEIIRGITTLPKVIDPDDQEEVEGSVTKGQSAKDMFGTQVIYFGIPWFSSWPIRTVNGQTKLLWPEKGTVTKCSHLSGARIWVTLPDLSRC